jgi:hypothetical protein
MTITITPDVTAISRSTIISFSSDAGAITAIILNAAIGTIIAWNSSSGFLTGYTGTEDGPKENITISKVGGWDTSLTSVLATGPTSSRVYTVVVPTSLTVLTPTLIRLTLTDEVVVDDAYYDPANYYLTTPTGVGPEILGVLLSNSPTTPYILLTTNTMVEGTTYTLNFSDLSLRTGLELSIIGDFIARPTKLSSLLRSIPSHYDTRSSSNLFGFLAAIGVSDDIIGGSRNDSINFD